MEENSARKRNHGNQIMKNLKQLPFQVSQRIVDLCREDNELKTRLKVEFKASHEKLWAAVHDEYPELDVNGVFSLACRYIEQDIVMLEVSEGRCSHGMDGLKEAIGRMLKDIN